MPRLPTMRVIGSQDISTSLRVPVGAARSGKVVVVIMPFLSSRVRVCRGTIAGCEFVFLMSPLRLFVQSALRKGTQRSHHAAIDADRAGRELGAGRLVHEQH